MLQIQGLAKSYGGQVLFRDIRVKLPESQKIALIGQNGAGKTTLLNIICGLDDADDGQVQMPKNRTIGYLPQEPNQNPKPTVLVECESGAKKLGALKEALERGLALMQDDHSEKVLSQYEEAESAFRLAGGYSLTARATHFLRGLGFSEAMLDYSPLDLSGGYRMRLELAKIFLDEPDLLILDEPTNHLDLPSLVWVEAWLKQFGGTVLFVSHDRDLLNRLSTHTLYLSGGELNLYTGNFDAFLLQKSQREEQVESERKTLEGRRKEHEHFVERFGAKATKAKQAQSRVKMIARLRALESDLPETEVEKTISISVPVPPKSAREILTLDHLTIGYDPSLPLATDVRLAAERGQKIAIIGANGIGKSTLIKTLTDHVSPLSGSYKFGSDVTWAYFAQDQADSLDQTKDLVENVLAASLDINHTEARKLLGGLLFRDDDVHKKAGVLSGGEKNRLGFACLLAQNANLLFLDEPTNHLDMSSVAVLIDALSRYQGTVVFVSHDRTFINQLATHVFVMLPDGRSELFLGDLDDYARLAVVQGFPNVLDQEVAPSGEGAAQGKQVEAPNKQRHASMNEVKELKRRRQKLERQVAACESEQADMNRELASLEAQSLAVDPSDYDATQSLHSATIDLRAKLEASEEDWLLASDELEKVTGQLKELGRLS